MCLLPGVLQSSAFGRTSGRNERLLFAVHAATEENYENRKVPAPTTLALDGKAHTHSAAGSAREGEDCPEEEETGRTETGHQKGRRAKQRTEEHSKVNTE